MSSAAISGTGASGATVTTGAVITSWAFICSPRPRPGRSLAERSPTLHGRPDIQYTEPSCCAANLKQVRGTAFKRVGPDGAARRKTPVTRINPVMAHAFAAASAIALAATSLPALAAWQPTRPVELIVPAGTGGGADQMARMIQGIVQKHNLMPQSLVVINKAGGAGAEGFLDVKGSAGNPNKIVITLSNVFTTPLATGVPFNYQEITPVGMLAMDEFVLWVNAKSPYQTAGDYVAALKSAPAGQMKMGGSGSK